MQKPKLHYHSNPLCPFIPSAWFLTPIDPQAAFHSLPTVTVSVTCASPASFSSVFPVSSAHIPVHRAALTALMSWFWPCWKEARGWLRGLAPAHLLMSLSYRSESKTVTCQGVCKFLHIWSHLSFVKLRQENDNIFIYTQRTDSTILYNEIQVNKQIGGKRVQIPICLSTHSVHFPLLQHHLPEICYQNVLLQRYLNCYFHLPGPWCCCFSHCHIAG